jgi:DinB superfamily
MDQLLHLIDEAFDKKAWHGPTLRGALRGVTAAQAAWRASPRTHNIWELTVHAAYWKYAVRRRLTGEKRGRFPLDGSNWFERPLDAARNANPDDRLWQADLTLLAREHRELRGVVEALNPEALGGPAKGKTTQSVGFIVRGIAAHDLYHAGQIQLLKRLFAHKGHKGDKGHKEL